MANPNPNQRGLIKFKKGKSGNPGGKSKERVALERRNAQKAMELREKLLNAMARKIDEFEASDEVADKDKILAFIEASVLKLIKDSEDRGLGAPVQDHRSSDGSMTPSRIEIVSVNGNSED